MLDTIVTNCILKHVSACARPERRDCDQFKSNRSLYTYYPVGWKLDNNNKPKINVSSVSVLKQVTHTIEPAVNDNALPG